MKTIVDRMFEIMDFKHWKQKDLAVAMQVSPPSASAILKKKALPSYESIKNLLQCLPDISAAWLINGEGSMLFSQDKVFVLPILGEIAAGVPMEFTDFIAPSSISIPFNTMHPTEYHALKVFGDSMSPIIMHNDIVIVHTVFNPWNLDGKVVAVKIDTETTLKHLFIDHNARQSILIPYNTKNYKPIILDENSPNTIILGYMVSLIRLSV